MGYKRPHVNYVKSGKMQLEARAMKLVLQQPLRTVERLNETRSAQDNARTKNINLGKKKEKESLTSHGTLSSGT